MSTELIYTADLKQSNAFAIWAGFIFGSWFLVQLRVKSRMLDLSRSGAEALQNHFMSSTELVIKRMGLEVKSQPHYFQA
jgi:hypothetical protein